MGITVSPLSPAFGVEVHGVNLDRGLDADEAATLLRLFDEHSLLIFRDQDISANDQVDVCRALRPVVEPHAWVSNVEPGFHPEGELLCHSDFAFTPSPMLGLSLYAIEIADGAAPTKFASNARAARRLPDSLRARVQGLEVVHLIDSVNGRDNVRTRACDVGGDEAPADLFPRFARPVIWKHPVTGVELLFVLEQQASHFVGWSCEASDELLDALFAVVYEPTNVYEHEWRVGDLAVWDNLALQHGRRANPNTVRRSLRRVTMNTVTTADLIAGSGFDPVRRQSLRAQTRG